jgi:hypothetical protein
MAGRGVYGYRIAGFVAGCPEHGPAPKGRHCLKTTHVRFRITVTG